MPRINLDQVRGLPDIVATDNYTFTIGSIPGGSNDSIMQIKCQQAIYPGMGTEDYDVALHGFVVKYRGRKTFPRTMSITYVEDTTMDTTFQLESWLEYKAGTISGNSQSYKRGNSGYSVDGSILTLYDTTGEPIKEIIFYGLQINDKADIQLDGSSSTLMLIQATFGYDYYTASGITIL